MLENATLLKHLSRLTAVALLLIVAAPSAWGEEASATVPSFESSAEADPCAQPDLLPPVFAPDGLPAFLLQGAGSDAIQIARPPFLKTCRCSCGYPCTTNEDCGPGGLCSAGITCCAAPDAGGEETESLELPSVTVPSIAVPSIAVPSVTVPSVESVAAAAPCAQPPAFVPDGFPALAPQLAGSEATQIAGPPFQRRTCACSCGLPCTTDADCGFGGICISGFTCCRAPDAGVDEAPAAGTEAGDTEVS